MEKKLGAGFAWINLDESRAAELLSAMLRSLERRAGTLLARATR